ncbi:MAG: hypothetical protein II345_07370 [Alistipes sp.]|nr:hypothetical protein [Alistipes sp.]MBQ5653295.1 hypothetical protein [Alistipes sp.]MBQ5903555.1 hypothetical protein [Alistipes sp.]
MEEKEFYDQFEEKMLMELLKLCTSKGKLEGTLLSSEDIDERWKEYAPHYMADAVSQINDYPAAAMAWAAYVGMAVANRWDADWATYATEPYEKLHGKEGFDDMDEHILQNILGLELESEAATAIEDTLRSCAQLAITLIRREQIEAQSTKAFYVFARTTRSMFRIGASLELKRLGYRFEKANLSEVN